MILVTRWGQPPWGPTLILSGTVEQTRKEAEQYFDGEITGFESRMDQDEFNALPEFEG